MLTIPGSNLGPSDLFCDGLNRRNFLKIGGLALGGLSMPQLLLAQSQSGVKLSHKAIIMIYLPGGPSHQDMFDPKPNAPLEIRGELTPIKTNVPGIEICETFPRLARMMDKVIPIRTIVGSSAGHTGYQCMTGNSHRDPPEGGWPYIGSVLSRLEGPVDPVLPTSLDLTAKTLHSGYYKGRDPGFAGTAHAPLRVADEQTKNNMVLKGVSLNRLRDRQSLLASFDQFRREMDVSGVMGQYDESHQQAFNILTSSKLAEAFDLEKEDPALRDRYGRGRAKQIDDASPMHMDQFVLARRLVEAGARCVTLGFGGWDYHDNAMRRARREFPKLDQGVSGLVQDLHDRGLDQDVTVVVWGEFGRTPKINKIGGRDHWPAVSCALLAGGGMRTGQVIGETDGHAAEVKSRPVHFQEVFATLYHNMGISADRLVLNDLSGRPQHLIGNHKPIREIT